MSARAIFARSMAGLLNVLGEQAFLRGIGCQVNIERGVSVTEDDGAVFTRDIATIHAAMSPKRGDLLAHPEGNYRLDRLYAHSSATVRYIVVPFDGTMPPIVSAPDSWRPPATGSTFAYSPPAPSMLWEIEHGLGRFPSVTVVDTAGIVVTAGIVYVGPNVVHIQFNAPFTGTAYLN